MKEKKIYKLLFIGFLLMFIYSLINIVIWFIDNNKTSSIIEDINNKVVLKIDNTPGNIINENTTMPKSNPYWDFIKENFIDVDFTNLKSINEDIIGWIYLPGTNINYPFVQTNDNDYYLNHSIDNKYNSAGWVFLDYRNNISNLSKNTIIYAHGRLDETMFGSLRKLLKTSWQDNTDNHIIKTSTESSNSIWQIFSVYVIATTTDYIEVSFENNKKYLEFINLITKRSVYDFDTVVNEKDFIITLSTCYNDNEKLVVHAKLIKQN